MRNYIFAVAVVGLCFTNSTFAQVEGSRSYSKEVAMYRAKEFLMLNVLDTNDTSVEFELTPLVAESSGELTTIIFKCEEQNKSGLLIGFFNDQWIYPTGVPVESYSFKVFYEDEAIEFINLINTEVEKSWKFLREDWDNNNLIVSYQDVRLIIWTKSTAPTIRVFWKGYDAEWRNSSFKRSVNKFERKIDQ
jgi:hypothetical protein